MAKKIKIYFKEKDQDIWYKQFSINTENIKPHFKPNNINPEEYLSNDKYESLIIEENYKYKALRLLSDNGPCYLSKELKEYLEDNDMTHTRGRPYHPQTQGKIERYHQTMKNVVKLHYYYSPEELERALESFVYQYNNHRYHESLNNVTPADMYHGKQRQILSQREKIKRWTLQERKRYNLVICTA